MKELYDMKLKPYDIISPEKSSTIEINKSDQTFPNFSKSICKCIILIYRKIINTIRTFTFR